MLKYEQTADRIYKLHRSRGFIRSIASFLIARRQHNRSFCGRTYIASDLEHVNVTIDCREKRLSVTGQLYKTTMATVLKASCMATIMTFQTKIEGAVTIRELMNQVNYISNARCDN